MTGGVSSGPIEAVGGPGAGPAGVIEIRVRTLSQLFHSLDPSPFRDRDLDQAAAQFIVESAIDLPDEVTPRLVVRLPTEECANAEAIPTAVHTYFRLMRESTQRQLRELLRDGRAALALGLVVVIVVIAVVETLRSLVAAQGSIAAGVLESLTIVAWVILWRPLEILLYDRLPLKRRARLYEKLERIEVRVVAASGG